MRKLAIVTTHPIQYYAPLFRSLNARSTISIKVFYTWGKASLNKHDPGFNTNVAWDVPLLEGYNYEWVKNVAKDPGSHHFHGIVTPGLVDEINAYHPDAVLVIGWAFKSHLTVIRYFHGKVPVYFRGDSTLLDERSGIKTMFRKFFLKWLYGHIDHAFYVGSASREYFLKFGLKPHQLSFAPHAVENDRFAINRTAEATELRDRSGIPQDDLVILFAGKFEAKKSPMLLLNAFINMSHTNKHLLFVGNGELEQELKRTASDRPNIHFMNFVNQSYMPVVYQACDVFCLPSKGPNETWGLAVNEAMACGKAIVVSNKCGCAVDLVNTTNGAIFESENMDDLILALKTVTASIEHTQELSKASEQIIVSWTIARIAEAIERQLSTDID